MKQSRTRLASKISDITLSKGSSKELAKKVAAYLMSEKRTGELDSLMRDVSKDWADNGYVEVIAHSAHALDASTRAKIEAQVKKVYPTAKTIKVTEQRDPEVIGGVKLELPNKQLDLTVEAKLNQFKQLTNA